METSPGIVGEGGSVHRGKENGKSGLEQENQRDKKDEGQRPIKGLLGIGRDAGIEFYEVLLGSL